MPVARRARRAALMLVIVLSGLSAFAPAARAQSIYLKDGQIIAAQGLRRDGATVLARIQMQGGAQGEVGYPVENVARIEFPEPAQLKLAGDLLNAGKPDEALRQLGPIIVYYAPFHDIPGNFWTPLALLQLDAFARLGRDREVNTLIGDITRFGGMTPDTLRAVKIRQAAAAERQGDHHTALDSLDPIVKDATAPLDSLSEAWLTVGQARLALREYREALLAFLHVPVYTPEKALLMPPALLGSAAAYIGLDDGQRAQTALKELIAAYPNAPEVTEARDRLQKLAARVSKPAGG